MKTTARTTMIVGGSAVVLAIAFNIPFAVLAATFDYPGILRRPAAEVLAAFSAGGTGLILTWYSFMLCALALVAFAPALALADDGLVRAPGLTLAAALTGALAGLAQAVGLARWVFAVPALATAFADPATDAAHRAAIEVTFQMLNLWGGVAIGEHLGQALTALWIGLAVAARVGQAGWLNRLAVWAGGVAVAGILFGLGEGLALALDVPGDIFSFGTIAGYMAMTVWLILTGFGLVMRGVDREAGAGVGAGVAPVQAA